MADSKVLKRCLNPVILNFQKMELELKCPTCLNLMDLPVMLPCTHIFCSHCITVLSKSGCKCPSCKLSFLHQDMRPACYINSFLNIYRDMNSAVAANFPHQKYKEEITDKTTPIRESPLSGNNNVQETSQRKPIDGMARDKKLDHELCTSIAGIPREEDSDEIATETRKKHMQTLGDDALVDKGGRCIPPSFGSNKDSDCNNGDTGNAHVSDTGNAHQIKRSLLMVKEMEVSDELTTQFGIGNAKRPKLNGDSDVGDKGGIRTRGLKTTNLGCQHNQESCSDTHPLDASRYSTANRVVECAFCHSFRATECSGSMLHFLNGKEVDVGQAAQPNVFHVHENCIQWAPQIYFSGETIKNLEVELSRASRIKCSSCGLKGAALGCYVKRCRKSYHVPCAFEIGECRWDCENFLVLCPSHSSHKLPCDRSKSQPTNRVKHSIDSCGPPRGMTSTATEECGNLTMSPGWGGDLILCGSALSTEEKGLLDKFTSTSKAIVANCWEPNVTHVIASVDNNGGCSRTSKYIMAVLTGKWVVTIEWIKACIKAGHLVPEEPYEVTHDVHGCYDWPKIGRSRSMRKAPKLFSGRSYHVTNDFHQACFKKCLEDLILAGGGTLLMKDDLSRDRQPVGKESSQKACIIYSAELPLTGDRRHSDAILKKRSVKAKALAAEIGGEAVRHTLFLNNVAGCHFELGW